MLKKLIVVSLGIAALMLWGCDKPNTNTTNEELTSKPPTPQTKPQSATDSQTASPLTFQTVEWTNLIPEADLNILLNPPSYITDIEDGSSDDEIGNEIRMTVIPNKDDPYQQALVSTRIIPEMNGKPIRIPGFIVPLEFDDTQSITKFFLVPFFGACIHLPPPPPNQIIYVDYPKGLRIDGKPLSLDETYNPYWISGVLGTTLVENETATAAYTMELHTFEIYSE